MCYNTSIYHQALFFWLLMKMWSRVSGWMDMYDASLCGVFPMWGQPFMDLTSSIDTCRCRTDIHPWIEFESCLRRILSFSGDKSFLLAWFKFKSEYCSRVILGPITYQLYRERTRTISNGLSPFKVVLTVRNLKRLKKGMHISSSIPKKHELWGPYGSRLFNKNCINPITCALHFN